MQKLNWIGKTLLAIGILSLFRRVRASDGFGGHVDNVWEILVSSLLIITVATILILISNKLQENN